MLAARITLPVILAFSALLIAWADPVANRIGSFAALIGTVLPRGRYWPATFRPDGPPSFASWSQVTDWFIARPTPVIIFATIAAAHLAIWLAVRRVVSRRGRGVPALLPTFGGPLDSFAVVLWTVIAALLWRFYWGLMFDRLVAGQSTIPIRNTPGHITAMWIGAALGYGWTIAFFSRASGSAGGEQICHQCGYSLAGLSRDQGCPECGQVQTAPLPSRPPTPRSKWLRRFSALLASVCLLTLPYTSTLICAVLPDAWILFISDRLPAWW